MSRHHEQGERDAVDLASRFCRPWKAMSADFSLTKEMPCRGVAGYLSSLQGCRRLFTEHLGCASIL